MTQYRKTVMMEEPDNTIVPWVVIAEPKAVPSSLCSVDMITDISVAREDDFVDEVNRAVRAYLCGWGPWDATIPVIAEGRTVDGNIWRKNALVSVVLSVEGERGLFRKVCVDDEQAAIALVEGLLEGVRYFLNAHTTCWRQ